MTAACRDSITTLGALVLLGVASAMILLILPLVVGAVTVKFGLSPRMSGLLASADMVGAGVGMLYMSRRLDRYDWRNAALAGASILVVGNTLSAFIPSERALCVVRLLTGCGAGMGLGVANAGLATTAQPDRNIGIYIVAALVSGAAVLRIYPAVASEQGVAGIYGFLAVTALFAACVTRALPAGRDRSASFSNRPDIPSARRVRTTIKLAGVAGILAYFLGVGTIWANMARLGAMRGLDAVAVGSALGVASLMGGVGGVGSIILANRFGRFWPVTTLFAGSLGAMALLDLTVTRVAFAIAASLVLFGWNFSYPYMIGTMMTLDETAALVPLAGAMQLLGIALGPLLAATALGAATYAYAPAIGAACFVTASALLVPIVKMTDRFQPMASPRNGLGH